MLSDALADFLHDCAYAVTAFGEAFYEIVYWSEAETGRFEDFELRPIAAGTVRRQRGGFVQHVPPAVAQRWGAPERIELAPDHVLAFLPPVVYRAGFATMLQTLATADALAAAGGALRRRIRDSAPVPFDPGLHAAYLAVARSTRAIGWNVRRLIFGEVSDYYLTLRQLRFERFKCLLRDDIIATLNDGLVRVGARAGFTARIAVEGMVTTEDVDEADAHLALADRPFDDVLKPFLQL